MIPPSRKVSEGLRWLAGHVGRKVRKQRQHLGLSVDATARALGYKESFVRRIENGYGLPDVDDLPKLASALGLTVAELLPRVFSSAEGERLASHSEERDSTRHLSSVVREQRARHDLFLKEIAFEVGVSKQMVSKLVHGEYRLNLYRYPALAKALRVRVRDLLPSHFWTGKAALGPAASRKVAGASAR